jgi:FtsH-binding integral membrane protein
MESRIAWQIELSKMFRIYLALPVATAARSSSHPAAPPPTWSTATMRSVWAVLSGFILIGLLGFGTDAIMHAMSPWAYDEKGGTTNLPILLVSMVYSAVYGLVGCYATARLAPSNPMKHSLILGGMGVVITSLINFQLWGHVPAWWSIANVLVVMPLAWAAGRLRENEMASRGLPG